MDDYELALQLQFELNDTPSKKSENQLSNALPSKTSLVDDSWELLDPNPDARALFLEFNATYFWGKLAGVEVRWSPRMTMCAGICCYEGRGGLCSIRLSKPLLSLRPRKDLVETLLHEMIHAYLFVTQNNKDHDGHGPEFHKHMYRINNDAGTNISVYHNFHDEVAHFQQHWWKCDGPCQHRPPYHGLVKRATNRAPSANDFWWERHRTSCGGTYHKIKEPEGYGQKKTKKPKEEKPEKPRGCQDIRKVIGGLGNPLNAENRRTSPVFPPPSRPVLPDLPTMDSESFVPVSPTKQSPRKTFPGTGLALKSTGGANSTGSSGPIVRRLPGIGVITNARPVENNVVASQNGAVHNGDSKQVVENQAPKQDDGDNSDDDIILYSPDAMRESKAATSSKSHSASSGNSCDANSGVINHSPHLSFPAKSLISKSSIKTDHHSEIVDNHKKYISVDEPKSSKRRSIIMPFDSDSDKEFDTLLNTVKEAKQYKRNSGKVVKKSIKKDNRKLKQQKSASLSSLRDATSTMIGACKKITDFMSVSNPNSPRVLKERSKNEPIESSPESYTRGEKVVNFSVNRNKRAHVLISSDSDESNEGSLSNASKRKKRRGEWFNTRASGDNASKAGPSATVSKAPAYDASDNFSDSNALIAVINSAGANTSTRSRDTELNEASARNSVTAADIGDEVALVSCPVCQTQVPATAVNVHLDQCLGMT